MMACWKSSVLRVGVKTLHTIQYNIYNFAIQNFNMFHPAEIAPLEIEIAPQIL